MDKSFEGLLFSVIVHALILWILLFGKLAPVRQLSDKTEVTFIEKPKTISKKDKMRQFVTETENKSKDLAEATKDEADFLSMFTKRVKKQLRAANLGPTVNSV